MALTNAAMTGGHTPLPSMCTFWRRVPKGSWYSSVNPIARISSGTCSIRI